MTAIEAAIARVLELDETESALDWICRVQAECTGPSNDWALAGGGFDIERWERMQQGRDRTVWNSAIRAAAEQCHDPILHTAIARLLKPEPKE